MLKKVLFGFCLAALAMASAAETYRVRLPLPTALNGTALNAGEYRVIVAGEKAVFQMGKQKAESHVKVERQAEKYESTIFTYNNAGGTVHLIEIRLAERMRGWCSAPTEGGSGGFFLRYPVGRKGPFRRAFFVWRSRRRGVYRRSFQ